MIGNDETHNSNGAGGAASWRDVYTEVGKSEERVKLFLKEILGPIVDLQRDHESRLRNIELSGSKEAQEAISDIKAMGVRVTAVELVAAAFTQRERGIMAALSAGQKLILLVIAIIGGVVGFVSLLLSLQT